jgi:mono/diheme cytochrome c family protein
MLRYAISRLSVALIVTAALSSSVLAQDRFAEAAATFARVGCVGCHGPQGLGTALAPAIAGPSLTVDAFRTAVRTSRGAMPAFSADVLSNDAVTALHVYLSSQPALETPAGRAEAGGSRFEQAGCYSCHSNQGQGGTQGPRIGPRPIRWERFAWYVRHPTGQMPPYSVAVLTDQDLADIHAFLAARPEPQLLSEIPLLAP